MKNKTVIEGLQKENTGNIVFQMTLLFSNDNHNAHAKTWSTVCVAQKDQGFPMIGVYLRFQISIIWTFGSGFCFY